MLHASDYSMAMHASAINSEATVSDPESEIWVRMPANREKLEGLSRATLYKLVNDARSGVVTISLREPRTERGVRLLGLRSLRRYLANLARDQMRKRASIRDGS
jgi:hypothetical protein